MRLRVAVAVRLRVAVAVTVRLRLPVGGMRVATLLRVRLRVGVAAALAEGSATTSAKGGSEGCSRVTLLLRLPTAPPGVTAACLAAVPLVQLPVPLLGAASHVAAAAAAAAVVVVVRGSRYTGLSISSHVPSRPAA